MSEAEKNQKENKETKEKNDGKSKAPSLKSAVKGGSKSTSESKDKKKQNKPVYPVRKGRPEAVGLKRKNVEYKPKLVVEGTEEQKQRLLNVQKRLGKSAMGRYLMGVAANEGYSLEIGEGLEALGLCDPNRKALVIGSSANDDEAVATLAHEMRHAHQYASGMNLYAEVDSTKTQLQITRAMEADAEANAGIVCQQLKAIGDEGPWQSFVKDGPETAKAMEEAYEKFKNEHRGSKTKHVLMAGFRGWYRDYETREAYDKQHIELMDEIRHEDLADQYAFDRSCPTDTIVQKICRIGQHANYFDQQPELLDQKEYMGVSDKTMAALKDFFEERHKKHGIPADKSLEDIPVYQLDHPNAKKRRRGNQRSVYWGPVKEQAVKKRQERARLDIMRRKQEQMVANQVAPMKNEYATKPDGELGIDVTALKKKQQRTG